MATQIDLFNLIFQEILKISPSLITKYTTIQDQILYLILIPTVIIFLFIWTFGYWIVGTGHRGLRLLISAIAYIYIVWSGWYGTWIIPIVMTWFPMVLFAFFIFFILTRIIHPLNIGGASKIMKAGFEKASSKGKKINELEKQIDLIDKKIRDLERERNRLTDGQARQILKLEIVDLKQKKKQLKDAIDSLEE